jgi:hypothetical protein
MYEKLHRKLALQLLAGLLDTRRAQESLYPSNHLTDMSRKAKHIGTIPSAPSVRTLYCQPKRTNNRYQWLVELAFYKDIY